MSGVDYILNKRKARQQLEQQEQSALSAAASFQPAPPTVPVSVMGSTKQPELSLQSMVSTRARQPSASLAAAARLEPAESQHLLKRNNEPVSSALPQQEAGPARGIADLKNMQVESAASRQMRQTQLALQQQEQELQQEKMRAQQEQLQAAKFYKKQQLMGKLKENIPKQIAKLGAVEYPKQDVKLQVEAVPLAVVSTAAEFAKEQLKLSHSGSFAPEDSVRIKQFKAQPLLSNNSSVDDVALQIAKQHISQNQGNVQQIYQRQQQAMGMTTLTQLKQAAATASSRMQPLDLQTSVKSLQNLSESLQLKSLKLKRNCFMDAYEYQLNDAQPNARDDIALEATELDLQQFKRPAAKSAFQVENDAYLEQQAGSGNERDARQVPKKSVLLAKLHDDTIFLPKLAFKPGASKNDIRTDFGKNVVDYRQINHKQFQLAFQDLKMGQLPRDGLQPAQKPTGFRAAIVNQAALDRDDLLLLNEKQLKDDVAHEQQRVIAGDQLFDSQIDYMSVSKLGQLNLKNRIYQPGTQGFNTFQKHNRLLELDDHGLEQFAKSLLGKDSM